MSNIPVTDIEIILSGVLQVMGFLSHELMKYIRITRFIEDLFVHIKSLDQQDVLGLYKRNTNRQGV